LTLSLRLIFSTGTVILPVTYPAGRNATVSLVAMELVVTATSFHERFQARTIGLAEEVIFITPVHAVVLVVALPGGDYTPLVVALEPVGSLTIVHHKRILIR